MPTSPTRAAAGTEASADLRTLQDAVDRLGREVLGLREAQHRRTVIEQAKGVLMVTLRCSADEAFEHLRRVSRETNRRVVDVAADELARLGSGEVRVDEPPVRAALTGPPLPLRPDGRDVEGADGGARDPSTAGHAAPLRASPPSSLPSSPLPSLPGTPERDRRLVLLEIAARGSATLDELARSFVRLCSWPVPPDYLIVQRIGAGSTLDLVCSVGFPADFRARWRQVPLAVDMPVGHTGRTGEVVFVEDAADVADRWPALAYEGVQACAVLPVVTADAVVAVLGLAWSRPVRLLGHDRRMLRAAVTAVAGGLTRLLPSGGVETLLAGPTAPEGERTAVRTALDAMFEEAVLLLPVAAERDLRLVWCNAAAVAGAPGLVPGRVSEVAPHVVGSELWRCCRHVLQHRSRAELRTTAWWWGEQQAGEPRAVRVAAMWNGLLVTRT